MRPRPLHLLGIGGAGMSGLARLAHQAGYRVSGSDREDSAALRALRAAGIEAWAGHGAAAVPAAAEGVVVSTAIPPDNPELADARARGLPVLHRAELLAELMEGRRGLAVAGAHGKSTTSAMLSVALGDPSACVGATIPGGAGTGARWGSGPWFVAEADESDRSLLRLRPEAAILVNVDHDHHATFRTLEEVREVFRAFLAPLPREGVVVVGPDPEARACAGAARCPVRRVGGGEAFARLEDAVGGPELAFADGRRVALRLAVPGRHNAENAACALVMADWCGTPLEEAAGRLAGFRGVGRRFEERGEAGGVRVVDDYAHHPAELRATLAAARAEATGRVIAIFQPHLYSRTRALSAELGAALGAADVAVVTEVYAAREAPVEGVSGSLVADAVPLPARARFVPDLAGAGRAALREARPGDLILTLGAGDVTTLGQELIHSLQKLYPDGEPRHGARRPRRPPHLPAEPIAGAPLAPLTTIRVGGRADWLARVTSSRRVVGALAWARARGLPVAVVGRGSNLLVADAGFRGLALRLEGPLAGISVRRDGLWCGGGASLPRAVQRAAAHGLAGLEFGASIPGTAGGAVAMNAGAHDGELAQVLAWAAVCAPDGRRRAGPEDLGLGYRRSTLAPGEVVSALGFRLVPADTERIAARLAEFRARRRATQPQGARTFGSVFTNPPGDSAGRLLEAAGAKMLARGGARFSPVHANFIEAAPGCRAEDVLALMAEGRRRVVAAGGPTLVPEVRYLDPEHGIVAPPLPPP